MAAPIGGTVAMKSISASIIVLAAAILIAQAAAAGAPRDSWIIVGGLGVLLLLVGLITWFGSIGRGPLDKE
jgi:hypothetical protein